MKARRDRPQGRITKAQTGSALVLAPFFEPAFRGGGPIQTLGALVRATPAGIDVSVLTVNRDLGDKTPLPVDPNTWLPRDGFRIRYVSGGSITFGSALVRTWKSLDPDIVYINSFFNPWLSIMPQLIALLVIPRRALVLIAPRGELDPGALELKAWKKRAYVAIYRLLGFQRRSVWHASSPTEAAQIRRTLGARTRVIVKENETSLALTSAPRGRREPGYIRLIFASRLVEKKGLHVLLKALQGCEQPAQLEVIGGFETDDYERICTALVRDIPSHIVVNFRGSLKRDSLLERLGSADLLVFPTAGENFGHIIAESLSASCPVMTTAFTIWTRRLEAGAGVVVNSREPREWGLAIDAFIQGGPPKWAEYSAAAGEHFELWQREGRGNHVFQTALLGRMGE